MKKRQGEALVIQTIFDRFAETSRWPRFGEIERGLVTELDAEAVVHRVHRKTGNFPEWIRPDSEMVLPPGLMLRCHGVEEAFGLLVRALPVVLEVYLTNPEAPEVRDTHFQTRGWLPEDVERLGVLFQGNVPFLGGGGWSPGSWHWDIRPSIRRYAAAQSGRQYLQAWDTENRKHGKAQRRRRIASRLRGEHPLIWRVAVPILVAVASALLIGYLVR